MKRFRVTERHPISKHKIGPKALAELRGLDSEGKIFVWDRIDELWAQMQVGVVATPSCIVEIVPKACDDKTAAANLLYMLQVSGEWQSDDLGNVNLAAEEHSVLEAFLATFARRLLAALRRGVQHGYIERSENLLCIRGKIVVGNQVRRNHSMRHRVHCRYDDFTVDTPINRILKLGCRLVQRITSNVDTLRYLRESQLRLDAVEDVYPDGAVLTFNRNTQSLIPLVRFCQQLIGHRATAPIGGNDNSFSLLFPMERVFERFVGNLFRRHAKILGLNVSDIHTQGSHETMYLLQPSNGGAPIGRLKPDIILPGRAIIDTKWKTADDPARSDLYQMYAYARQFNAPRVVLLYPGQRASEHYHIYGVPQHRLSVAYLNVEHRLDDHLPTTLAKLKELLHS